MFLSFLLLQNILDNKDEVKWSWGCRAMTDPSILIAESGPQTSARGGPGTAGGLMFPRMFFVVALALFIGSDASAQQGRGQGPPPGPLPAGQTNEPFPQPIARTEGVITVTLREFASLPDIDGVAARHDDPRRRAGHEAPVRQ